MSLQMELGISYPSNVDYMNPSAQKIQELSVHYSNSLNILTAAKEKDGGIGHYTLIRAPIIVVR